jgi:N-methylhydantoinase B
MSARPDPFTLEVIQNALSNIAEEMSLVVMRSARSPLLREAGDLSSALTDAAGHLIAQGKDIPMHMGVMCFTVREFLKRVPPQKLRPGDVWFLNLPEIGGNHLPDVKAIRPIFVDGTLRAFAVSLAHWADIGGAVPGSYVPSARDAWQEGLRISPVRLFSNEPDREKLDFVLANVRGAQEREGDILAQMAATRTAEQRFLALCGAHSVGVVSECIEMLHDWAEAKMREVITQIPDGVYSGEDFLDDDAAGGPPLPIRVDVTINGSDATFDFSRSGDAAAGPLNTTPFIAAASVFYVMRALFAHQIPANGGCYRPLHIKTRPGSVLEPGVEKPVVGGNHETSQRIADALFRAFEPLAASSLTAGGPTTSGLLLFAGRRNDGQWVTLYETHGGGEGARTDRDGMPVIRVHMSNVMNTPAEIIETEYPLRVEFQKLRRGSGGAGRHRGGDGLHRCYRATANDISLTSMFERAVVPPYGLAGGEPGALFQVQIKRANGEEFFLPGKTNIRLNTGDRVIVESCGGGGYGIPADDCAKNLSSDNERKTV